MLTMDKVLLGTFFIASVLSDGHFSISSGIKQSFNRTAPLPVNAGEFIRNASSPDYKFAYSSSTSVTPNAGIATRSVASSNGVYSIGGNRNSRWDNRTERDARATVVTSTIATTTRGYRSSKEASSAILVTSTEGSTKGREDISTTGVSKGDFTTRVVPTTQGDISTTGVPNSRRDLSTRGVHRSREVTGTGGSTNSRGSQENIWVPLSTMVPSSEEHTTSRDVTDPKVDTSTREGTNIAEATTTRGITINWIDPGFHPTGHIISSFMGKNDVIRNMTFEVSTNITANTSAWPTRQPLTSVQTSAKNVNESTIEETAILQPSLGNSLGKEYLCMILRQRGVANAETIHKECSFPKGFSISPTGILKSCKISLKEWTVIAGYNDRCGMLNFTSEMEEHVRKNGLMISERGKIIESKIICIEQKKSGSLASVTMCIVRSDELEGLSKEEMVRLAREKCGISPSDSTGSVRIVESAEGCNYQMPEGYQELNYRFYMTVTAFGGLGLLGNVFAICVFVKGGLKRTHRSNPSIYFTIMLIQDCISLIFKMATGMVFMQWIPALGPLLCALSKFLPMVAANGSMLNIVAVTIERYIALCHPLKARTLLTKRYQDKVIEYITFKGVLCSG